MESFRASFKMQFFSLLNSKAMLRTLFMSVVVSLLVIIPVRDTFCEDYIHARPGVLMLVCGIMWMGIFDSIICVSGQRPVLEREFYDGENRITFLFAELLFRILHAIIESAVLFLISNLLIAFPETKRLVFCQAFDLFLTYLFTAVSAQVLGLSISCLASKNEQAMTLAPMVLIFELLMANIIFPIGESLPNFIQESTICRWGAEGIGSTLNILSYSDAVYEEMFDSSVTHIIQCWISLGMITLATTLVSAMGIAKPRKGL